MKIFVFLKRPITDTKYLNKNSASYRTKNSDSNDTKNIESSWKMKVEFWKEKFMLKVFENMKYAQDILRFRGSVLSLCYLGL